VIDNSAEIQLGIDVAVDGYTLAFRGSKPAMELCAYFDKRRKAIEELRPTSTWKIEKQFRLRWYRYVSFCWVRHDLVLTEL
jgi:hypothetical protein